MDTGIHIGAIVDKNALEPLTESILKILDAKADQETIRFALSMIGKVADISNVSIKDVSIYGDNHIEKEAE